jgi:predicted N-acyltransferase
MPTLKIIGRLNEIEPAAWDAIVGSESPFLEWGWLSALEDSGCVSRATGWLPQHLTLWEGTRLIGACPLYVKGHSHGEFVFDHGWADAALRAGIRYYPKLLVGVPFTPAAGRRFLSAPDVEPGLVRRSLAQALREICRENGFSSVHVNFCEPEEAEDLTALGFLRRTGMQFQWRNRGWQCFDEYLESLRSKRRIQIKRERRALQEQGVHVEVRCGAEIDTALLLPMFQLYKSTIDKLYWGRQYLNLRLFELLGERWRSRLCFFLAWRRERLVAGTFTVRKGSTLYGRYWGAFEPVRYLHFNLCYYESIDYCLANGIQRFEPGAGGEFKHLRGFDAYPTESVHHVADARLAAAVADYLRGERRAVASEIEWFDQRSAIKPHCGKEPQDLR